MSVFALLAKRISRARALKFREKNELLSALFTLLVFDNQLRTVLAFLVGLLTRGFYG